MEIAKQGDTIEWTMDSNNSKDIANKTFRANVAIVCEKEQQYGVYAEYGMDYIGFEQAKIINGKTKNL